MAATHPCQHGSVQNVTVRKMTPAEFDRWVATIAEEYADEQVAGRRWPAAGAVQRALEENAQLLPKTAR